MTNHKVGTWCRHMVIDIHVQTFPLHVAWCLHHTWTDMVRRATMRCVPQHMLQVDGCLPIRWLLASPLGPLHVGGWLLANLIGFTACGLMAACQSDGHLPIRWLLAGPLDPSDSTTCGLLRQCVAFHNTGCGWMVTCQSWEHLHIFTASQLCGKVPTTMCCVPLPAAGCLHNPIGCHGRLLATMSVASLCMRVIAFRDLLCRDQGSFPGPGPSPINPHPGCGPRSIRLLLHLFGASNLDGASGDVALRRRTSWAHFVVLLGPFRV